jgi:hypothetical protein
MYFCDNMKKPLILLALLFIISTAINAQGYVPRIHSNIGTENGQLVIRDSNTTYYLQDAKTKYTLKQVMGNPRGDSKGIAFYFGNDFKGWLYYGFIPYGDSKHPLPVYFKKAVDIENGAALINIKEDLSGKYDMIGWEKSGKGTIGYRLVNDEGDIIYDGKVSFTGKGPFKVAPTVVQGPFVNLVTDDGATISFTTNKVTKGSVKVEGRVFNSKRLDNYHEIKVKGLKPATEYKYTINYGGSSQTFAFTTAPKKGTRSAFVFSYGSDSRNGNGGGERSIYGANAYIMKKMMAMNGHKQIAFAQFSGDLIDGYLTDKAEINLQYANWKRAVEPFAHYFPIYISMGNHEALMNVFRAKGEEKAAIAVDKFPYKTESAEAVFAMNFVNPTNGPTTEDTTGEKEFPSYNENVYYYTYDNVAMVVLNSNYWYAPSTKMVGVSSGNIHGYIMDKQLAWLQQTIQILEEDKAIDHVFITLHTPFFPNGGHTSDDMWYKGSNEPRAVVKGKPVNKGIIERRDELLNTIVNKSSKTVAILTGDEHNYCKTEVSRQTPIYPEGWKLPKITLERTIYQINNGAAGAPYYAQEKTPWSEFTSGFTTQNAVVYFFVEGNSIEVQVVNPDTLEEIESFVLR